MYEGNAGPILRCGRCHKPFDKESTLKRHGYYCRSRTNPKVSRTRSCILCAKLKARCDNGTPGCSRCLAKGVDCRYPVKIAQITGSETRRDGDGYVKQQKGPSLSPQQSSADLGDVTYVTNPDLTSLDPEFGPLEDRSVDWDTSYIDFTDSWSPITTAAIHETLWSPPEVSTPLHLQPASIARSLIPRMKSKPSAGRTSILIFHILKSYLLMLEQPETLPPFIHPYLASSSTAESADTEFLTNCISLIRMVSHDVGGSRKLFWRNVKMECERMLAENTQMNKWQSLAAMQALSLYIIFRVNEGETEHNNFDSVLVAAVLVVSLKLSESIGTSSVEGVLTPHDPLARWKDWLFEESSRRLCVIYQVVNLLFYFEPVERCGHPTAVLVAPLPARKSLWAARDAFAWKAQIDKEPRAPQSFGLAADGELVKMGVKNPCLDNRHGAHQVLDARQPVMEIANWEEWCSEMDDFGGLIMLAASLVG